MKNARTFAIRILMFFLGILPRLALGEAMGNDAGVGYLPAGTEIHFDFGPKTFIAPANTDSLNISCGSTSFSIDYARATYDRKIPNLTATLEVPHSPWGFGYYEYDLNSSDAPYGHENVTFDVYGIRRMILWTPYGLGLTIGELNEILASCGGAGRVVQPQDLPQIPPQKFLPRPIEIKGEWSQAEDGKTWCYSVDRNAGDEPIPTNFCPAIVGRWRREKDGTRQCYPENSLPGTLPIEESYCR